MISGFQLVTRRFASVGVRITRIGPVEQLLHRVNLYDCDAAVGDKRTIVDLDERELSYPRVGDPNGSLGKGAELNGEVGGATGDHWFAARTFVPSKAKPATAIKQNVETKRPGGQVVVLVVLVKLGR